MELSLKICRCCGESKFQRLKSTALVDPFFARHGLQIIHEQQIDVPLLDWGLRRKIDHLPLGIARRLHRHLDQLRQKHLLTASAIRIPYGLCSHCHFLAPWYEIADDQLSDYYAYYLKEEYKQARTAFQPGFAELGQVMGSVEEATSRRAQHQTHILPHLVELRNSSSDGDLHVLDYGGGEGLIIPDFDWIKGTVYEIESDQSESSQPKNDGFDFVQCLHVLEHVGNPKKIYKKLINLCRRGGLIYIEVPMEFPGLKAIKDCELPICHEHINKFCQTSIEALQKSFGTELIYTQHGEVDFLHLDGMTPVLRGLARKP
jgi:hypothetical protein